MLGMFGLQAQQVVTTLAAMLQEVVELRVIPLDRLFIPPMPIQMVVWRKVYNTL